MNVLIIIIIEIIIINIIIDIIIIDIVIINIIIISIIILERDLPVERMRMDWKRSVEMYVKCGNRNGIDDGIDKNNLKYF